MALSLCLCYFQAVFLNNSVVSHCSLQPFLPCDPPESKETTHPSASVFAPTVCACVLCSILYSFSHVAPYAGNCICPAPLADFLPSQSSSLWFQVEASAKGDGAGLRSCCLMCHPWPQAMKWRGSYAQQPWPESALLHNSDCLSFTLVFFILANK